MCILCVLLVVSGVERLGFLNLWRWMAQKTDAYTMMYFMCINRVLVFVTNNDYQRLHNIYFFGLMSGLRHRFRQFMSFRMLLRTCSALLNQVE